MLGNVGKRTQFILVPVIKCFTDYHVTLLDKKDGYRQRNVRRFLQSA